MDAAAVCEGAETAHESLDRVKRMALALDGAALARVCAGLGIDVA